jgi:hypothetical protein
LAPPWSVTWICTISSWSLAPFHVCKHRVDQTLVYGVNC